MPIAIPSTSIATAVQGTQRSALTQSDASSSSSSFSDALSEAQTVAAATHGNGSKLAIAHLRSVTSGEKRASLPKANAVPAKSAPASVQTPYAPASSTTTRLPIQGDPLAATVQSTNAAQPAEPTSEQGSAKKSDDLKSGSQPSSLGDLVTAPGVQLAGMAGAPPITAATNEVPTPLKPSASMLPSSSALLAAAASLAKPDVATLPQEGEGQSGKNVAAPQSAAISSAANEMQQPDQGAASNSIEQATLAAVTSTTLASSTPTLANLSGVSSTATASAGKDATRNGTPGRSASPASKVSAPSPAATLSGQPTGLAAASPRTTAAGSIPTQEKANEQEGRGGHDSHKATLGVDAATKPATSGSQATASAADATAAVSPLLVMQNGAAQDANAATAANGLSQAVQQPDTSGQGTAGDKQGSQPGELPAAAAASADGQALPAINTARVLQSMQGTEMRVGMHTAEFGNISVNTSINTALNRQSIAAQISFEHLDLGRALTAHLPQIEAKLSSNYGMHARVEVKDQSAGPTSEGNREGARQQGGTGGGSAGRATSQMVSASATGAGAGESLDTANGSGARADALYHGTRLDIRA